MPTVMVTFVQTIYALVTFVYIINISAVTGPNFFDPIFLWSRFLWTKTFFDKTSLAPNFLHPIILESKFWWTKMFLNKTFSRPKILLGPKVFWQENLLDPKKILNSNFFSDINLFQILNCFSDPTFFWTQKFVQT